jgi:PAXNEB protein
MSSTFKRRTPSSSSSSSSIHDGVRPLSRISDSGTESISTISETIGATTKTTTTTNQIALSTGSFSRLPGTKPWTGGVTLTSTGLRELDTIISSAGQPLGTCIYIEEDRLTYHLSKSLVQYWCAEVCTSSVLRAWLFVQKNTVFFL